MRNGGLLREVRVLRILEEGSDCNHHQLERDNDVVLKAAQLSRVRLAGLRNADETQKADSESERSADALFAKGSVPFQSGSC